MTAIHLKLALVMALGGFALNNDHGSITTASTPPAEQTSKMKIRLTFQDTTLTATLYDTPTARDFASLLPLTLNLEDHARKEKVSDLPRELTTEGAPVNDPSVGDIALYAPWGNLAFYYADAPYADGIVLLGRIDQDVAILRESKAMKVTIKLVGP